MHHFTTAVLLSGLYHCSFVLNRNRSVCGLPTESATYNFMPIYIVLVLVATALNLYLAPGTQQGCSQQNSSTTYPIDLESGRGCTEAFTAARYYCLKEGIEEGKEGRCSGICTERRKTAHEHKGRATCGNSTGRVAPGDGP